MRLHSKSITFHSNKISKQHFLILFFSFFFTGSSDLKTGSFFLLAKITWRSHLLPHISPMKVVIVSQEDFERWKWDIRSVWEMLAFRFEPKYLSTNHVACYILCVHVSKGLIFPPVLSSRLDGPTQKWRSAWRSFDSLYTCKYYREAWLESSSTFGSYVPIFVKWNVYIISCSEKKKCHKKSYRKEVILILIW